MNLTGEGESALYRFLKPFLIGVALVMLIYGISRIGDVMKRVNRSTTSRSRPVETTPIGTVYYPESPEQIVLQLFRRSGAATLERRFMEDVPVFTLFGDGRVIYKQIGGYSWRQAKLTREELGRLIEEARRSGVFQLDVYSLQERIRGGRLTLRDLPSFTLRLNTLQHKLEITIYGLPDDPAILPHTLRDNATVAFVRFISRLMRFDEHVPSSQPYRPERAELLVREIGEVPEGISPDPLPFKLSLEGVGRYDGGFVMEISGEELAFFRRSLGSPGNFGYFSSEGSVFRIGFRPKL
jgi:hypothetical protein